MTLKFPNGFKFGAATSSYQIEGNHNVDGSGQNIWTDFSKQHKNTVINAHNGDIACDHYNRYTEDVALMKRIGLDSYRFSISWARIFPDGFGSINQKGLDFYSHLVDELLEKGIDPLATLYHWDLPRNLQTIGGWANTDIYEYFADYAGLMADKLGDRVSRWVTLNEPWVFMHLGHIEGEHAPGLQDLDYTSKAYKNIVLAHSNAARAMRTVSPDAEIGICCNYTVYEPASDSEKDIAVTKRYSEYQNYIFSDAWVHKSIPDLAREIFGVHNDMLTPKESAILASDQPDFLGLNYYTRYYIRHDEDSFLNAKLLTRGEDRTDMNWEVYPDGLRQVLVNTHERYNLPTFVTENGCAYSDQPIKGEVNDFKRVTYLKDHLKACLQAIEAGVLLKGYFAWSLLDNFEWAYGYTQRFGLIHVDFETQKRTLKRSALEYSKIIQSKKKPSVSKSTTPANKNSILTS